MDPPEIFPGHQPGLTIMFLTIELILNVINHKSQEKSINPELYPSLNQET